MILLRIKLFFTFILSAIIALVYPENARQVLDDHLNAEEERKREALKDKVIRGRVLPGEYQRAWTTDILKAAEPPRNNSFK